MEYADVRRVIEEHFQNNWPVSTIPVAWDNAQFSLPPNVSWVRLTLAYADAQNASFGDNSVHLPGIIGVQVFTPADKGTGEAYEIEDGGIIYKDKNLSLTD